MSAQRMTLERRKSLGLPASPGSAGRCGWRRAWSLLAIPLSGCGTGALWDKFTAKDDTFVEEPADKLYNEGLYLMNQRKDPRRRRRNSRKSTASILIPTGRANRC